MVTLSHRTGTWLFGELVFGNTFLNFAASLRDLATGTGGEFLVVDRTDEFLRGLTELLDLERTRYSLRYTPPTAQPGWHTLAVSTTQKGYQVTHRRGYWRPQ